jgi:hypothetical protein
MTVIAEVIAVVYLLGSFFSSIARPQRGSQTLTRSNIDMVARRPRNMEHTANISRDHHIKVPGSNRRVTMSDIKKNPSYYRNLANDRYLRDKARHSNAFGGGGKYVDSLIDYIRSAFSNFTVVDSNGHILNDKSNNDILKIVYNELDNHASEIIVEAELESGASKQELEKILEDVKRNVKYDISISKGKTKRKRSKKRKTFKLR